MDPLWCIESLVANAAGLALVLALIAMKLDFDPKPTVFFLYVRSEEILGSTRR